jgi:hypothetical protein
MIWDKIGYYDKTGLVKLNATPNSQPYCEGIVVPEVLPFRNQGQVTIFQQYNARSHTAGQTKKSFTAEQYRCIEMTHKVV